MKKLLLFIINFCFVAAMGQNLIRPITISLPPNPKANTADWATAMPPVVIMAQTKMDSGRISPIVTESKILVTIKSGGAVICGIYNQQTAPQSNFNSMTKTWSGAAVTALLGKDCVLKPGTYELCVQFYALNPRQGGLLGEACKTFTIADTKQQAFSPPQNVLPVNGKVFTEQEAGMPIMLRWTPVVPKPQGDVLYKVRLIEILPGQNKTEALRSNTPIDILEVKNSTQTSYKLSKRITGLYWEVEAESAERVQGEKPRSYGKSEATSFMMSSAGCGTNTDNVKVSCKGWVNGVPTYSVSITFNNIIPTSGGQQCYTVMNTIQSLTGNISGIATLPVTIPAGGSSPAVTFTYTPSVSGATTASFSYQGIWNDGNSNTSNFSNMNVVLPSCGCACGNWVLFAVDGKKYKCGDKFKWPCKKTLTFNGTYKCNPDDQTCSAITTWEIKNGNTTVKTGTGANGFSDAFTPTANGNYTITLHASCNGKVCDSCVITAIVDDCTGCDCGKWGPIKYGYKKGDIEQPWKSGDCGSTITAEKGYPYTFISYLSCKPSTECKPDSSMVTVYDQSGQAIYTTPGEMLNDFVFEKCGKYQVVFTAYCGANKCKCVLNINIPCCECKGPSTILLADEAGDPLELKCDSDKKVMINCNRKYALTAYANCSGPDCKSKVLISINGPGTNIVNAIAPLTFTLTQNGFYTATITTICGTDTCEPCKIIFVVDNCVDCCKGSKWGTKTWQGIPTPVNCNTSLVEIFPVNSTRVVNYTFNCNTGCKAKVRYDVINQATGAVLSSVTANSGANQNITMPSASGIYCLVAYGICDGKICDSCKVCFRTTCEDCNKVKITDNTVHVNGNYLSIKGSISTPGGVSKITAQLVSFSADKFPIFMNAIPVPNFEFALQPLFGISKINGAAVSLPFSLTGTRSNIAISNGPLPAVIPFNLKVDNYRYERFRHYRVKFTIFFANGSYCEKEIQKNL